MPINVSIKIMFVIAFCGKRYSGKDEGCTYLVSEYGFTQMDFSKNAINPILEKENKAITRDNQVELVGRLRKDRGINIFAKLLAEKMAQNSTISGLRYKEEAEYLREKFGNKFKLIAVEADDKIRYERSLKQKVKGEGSHTFEQFLERENLPTERVIPETMKLADFTITNNGSLEELYRQLDTILKGLRL